MAANIGCGKGGRSLAPVAGVVTLDGKPLAGGSVVFQPVAPPGSTIAGKGSVAFCDPEGRYQLETIDGRGGAVIGDHRVRIYGPKQKSTTPSNVDGVANAAPEIVPQKYNFDTTLTFTVPNEGTDAASFTLTTK